jgi:hypothetical protein
VESKLDEEATLFREKLSESEEISKSGQEEQEDMK